MLCLVLQSDADEIGDASTTCRLFGNPGSTDNTLKIHDGFYHEVLKELRKEDLLGEISAWLSAGT